MKTNEIIVDEGVWDGIKAAGSAAVGAVKGAYKGAMQGGKDSWEQAPSSGQMSAAQKEMKARLKMSTDDSFADWSKWLVVNPQADADAINSVIQAWSDAQFKEAFADGDVTTVPPPIIKSPEDTRSMYDYIAKRTAEFYRNAQFPGNAQTTGMWAGAVGNLGAGTAANSAASATNDPIKNMAKTASTTVDPAAAAAGEIDPSILADIKAELRKSFGAADVRAMTANLPPGVSVDDGVDLAIAAHSKLRPPTNNYSRPVGTPTSQKFVKGPQGWTDEKTKTLKITDPKAISALEKLLVQPSPPPAPVSPPAAPSVVNKDGSITVAGAKGKDAGKVMPTDPRYPALKAALEKQAGTTTKADDLAAAAHAFSAAVNARAAPEKQAGTTTKADDLAAAAHAFSAAVNARAAPEKQPGVAGLPSAKSNIDHLLSADELAQLASPDYGKPRGTTRIEPTTEPGGQTQGPKMAQDVGWFEPQTFPPDANSTTTVPEINGLKLMKPNSIPRGPQPPKALEEEMINEGGNAIDAAEPVNREDVPNVVETAKRLLPKELLKNLQVDIGSAGFKKKPSGDIDLMIEAMDLVTLFKTHKNTPEETIKAAKVALQTYLEAKGIDANVKGRNVHAGIPYLQKSTHHSKVAQVDYMVIEEVKIVAHWHQHGPRGMYDDDNFKGNEIFILISSIAKPLGLKFDPFAAKLVNRETGEIVARTRDQAAKILFYPPPKEKGDAFNSVRSMIKALENDPDKEIKLAQARADENKGLIKLYEAVKPGSPAWFRKLADL